MPIDVLRKDVALKDTPLVSQPVYRRERQPYTRHTHRVLRFSIWDVSIEIRRPTERSIHKDSGIGGNIELGIGSQLPQADRNPISQGVLLKPQLIRPECGKSCNIANRKDVTNVFR